MPGSMEKKRLVVGVSGASGSLLAIELLRQLKAFPEWETHLVMTGGARATLPIETAYRAEDVEALASVSYRIDDLGAAISSGTFRTEGMIVAPCSMKTLAGVATGYSDNLLLRAADVTLKERRPLVLVPRESPLNRIHLRNLVAASDAGAIIVPPMISYYNHLETVRELTLHVVGKILDIFRISMPEFRRWEGVSGP